MVVLTRRAWRRRARCRGEVTQAGVRPCSAARVRRGRRSGAGVMKSSYGGGGGSCSRSAPAPLPLLLFSSACGGGTGEAIPRALGFGSGGHGLYRWPARAQLGTDAED